MVNLTVKCRSTNSYETRDDFYLAYFPKKIRFVPNTGDALRWPHASTSLSYCTFVLSVSLRDYNLTRTVTFLFFLVGRKHGLSLFSTFTSHQLSTRRFICVLHSFLHPDRVYYLNREYHQCRIKKNAIMIL